MRSIVRNIDNHIRCEDRLFKAAGEMLVADYQMIYLNAWKAMFDIDVFIKNKDTLDQVIVEKDMIRSAQYYGDLMNEYHNVSFHNKEVTQEEAVKLIKHPQNKVVGVFVNKDLYKKIIKVNESTKMLQDFYPLLLVHYDDFTNTAYLNDVHLTAGIHETNLDLLIYDNERVNIFIFEKNEKSSKREVTIEDLVNTYSEKDNSVEKFKKALLEHSSDLSYGARRNLLEATQNIVRYKYLFTVTLGYVYEKTKNESLTSFINKFYFLADKWSVFWSKMYKCYLKNIVFEVNEMEALLNEIINVDDELYVDLLGLTMQTEKEVLVQSKTQKKYKKKRSLDLSGHYNHKSSIKTIEEVSLSKPSMADNDYEMFFVNNKLMEEDYFGEHDNMMFDNQKICIDTADPVSQIDFWGYSDNGNFEEELTVTYIDGSTEHFTVALSDKLGEPCFGESIVLETQIVLVKEGIVQRIRKLAKVYEMSIELEGKKSIYSIDFPNFSKMHVFKVVLCS